MVSFIKGQTPVGGLDSRICDSRQTFSWKLVIFSGCRNFLNRNAQTGNLFFASPLNRRPAFAGEPMDVESPLIYVIEDDDATRESFAALFFSQGFQVELFPTGESFLHHFQPARRGCIVTDLRLGALDGIDIHHLLKEAGYAIPVILISGYLNVRTAISAMEQGIFRVIEKPYLEDELVRAVRDALREDQNTRREKAYQVDFSHRLESLDARERLTLDLIVAGHGNRAIERRLGLSTRSVDRIRHSILEKTNYMSFVELSAAFGAAFPSRVMS